MYGHYRSDRALCWSERALCWSERAQCYAERALFQSKKFLCWPERFLCWPERALLWSTIQVGPLLPQESNLSLWEGLCCSERAPCQSVWVLNWPEWTQEITLLFWKGLMLP